MTDGVEPFVYITSCTIGWELNIVRTVWMLSSALLLVGAMSPFLLALYFLFLICLTSRGAEIMSDVLIIFLYSSFGVLLLTCLSMFERVSAVERIYGTFTILEFPWLASPG